MDVPTLGIAILAVIVVPLVTIGYVVVVEWLIRALSEKRRAQIRPWLWLLPAFVFLTAYLIYPMAQTAFLSFMDRRSRNFVGVDNYLGLFSDESFWQVVVNTALWLIFFTAVTVAIGLLIAILTDRVRYETAVKALIFIPMAISFVAAGVIWGFIYDFDPDIGTLNAVASGVGLQPQSWLTEWPRNTFMIIIVGIWMWVGFALVILSAGLKGISTELLEAARMDGANEFQVFRNIIVPLLAPTIAVVATTIVITALKTFDIVFVMTAGNFGTEVIASLFYRERFVNGDAGSAAAVAVILLLAIIPVMLINIRRFRAQEAMR